jgi:YsiA-like protein, C-terminal region
MMREQVNNQRGNTANLILELKKNNQELVKKLIQQGQKAGVFQKNIDIPLLMSTLLGTVSYLINTQHYYKEINNLQSLSEAQFKKLLKNKLSAHFKLIFKAILTNEG